MRLLLAICTSLLLFNGSAQVTITTVTVPPSCMGACDGYIEFTFSDLNNNPNYEVFLWSSSQNFTTNSGSGIFWGLCSGTYEIFVVDGNNDTTSTIVSLSSPPEPMIIVYDSTAYNGTLTITAFGGTPPYMYSINNGFSFQPTNLFTGLPPGNYYSSCLIQDANGCQSGWYTVVTYIPPYNCSVNLSSIGIDCSAQGVSDGEIEWGLTAQNPASEHIIYLEYPGGQLDSIVANPGVSTGTFSGLLHNINDYGVYMLSDSSCTDTNYINLGYAPPNLISMSIDIHQECGPCDHWLYWTYSDATDNGPYDVYFYDVTSGQVLLDSYTIPFQNSSNYEFDLCEGDYKVVVENSVGDTASISGSIVNDLVQGWFTNSTMVDSTVTCGASGGTPPYLYSQWTNGPWYSNNVFTGLPGNSGYVFLVKDANGCIDTCTVLWPDPNTTDCIISIIDSTVPVSCFDDCDGQIIWQLENAHPDSTYVLILNGPNAFFQTIDVTGGTTTGVFTNLCAGDYELNCSLQSVCSITHDVTVSGAPTPLSVQLTQLNNPNIGNYNGMFQLTGSGGTPPYQFSIDSGATWQPNGSFFGLPHGSYVVFVQDANGCETTITVMLHDGVGFENNELSSITVYPNPSSESIYIESDEFFHYQLFDIKGSIVLEGQIGNGLAVSVFRLEPGLYTMNLSDESRSFRIKIIVE